MNTVPTCRVWLWALALTAFSADIVAQSSRGTGADAGYLTRSRPALRFAPPPKPPVSSLPPVGIQPSSTPAVSDQFKDGPDADAPRPLIGPPKLDIAGQASLIGAFDDELKFQSLVKYFKPQPSLPSTRKEKVKFTPPLLAEPPGAALK